MSNHPNLLGVSGFIVDLEMSCDFHSVLGLSIERASSMYARATLPHGGTIGCGTREPTSSYDPRWEEPSFSAYVEGVLRENKVDRAAAQRWQEFVAANDACRSVRDSISTSGDELCGRHARRRQDPLAIGARRQEGEVQRRCRDEAGQRDPEPHAG